MVCIYGSAFVHACLSVPAATPVASYLSGLRLCVFLCLCYACVCLFVCVCVRVRTLSSVRAWISA